MFEFDLDLDFFVKVMLVKHIGKKTGLKTKREFYEVIGGIGYVSRQEKKDKIMYNQDLNIGWLMLRL